MINTLQSFFLIFLNTSSSFTGSATEMYLKPLGTSCTFHFLSATGLICGKKSLFHMNLKAKVFFSSEKTPKDQVKCELAKSCRPMLSWCVYFFFR